MDERSKRLRSSEVRFVEMYREIVLEEQKLGPPLEREIIVVRIDKSYLKLYGGIVAFLIILTIAALIFA